MAKKEKKAKKWQKVYTRKLDPFTAAIYTKAFAEKVPHKFILPSNNRHALHFKSVHLEKLVKNYLKFLKTFKPNKYAKVFKKEVNKFSEWLKEKRNTELRSLSNDELASLIEGTEARISSFTEEQLYTHLTLSQTNKKSHPRIQKTFPGLKKISQKNSRSIDAFLKSIMAETARRTDKKFREVKLMLPEEVVTLLQKGKSVSRNELAKRKRDFAAEFKRGKVKLHSGSRAVKKLVKSID